MAYILQGVTGIGRYRQIGSDAKKASLLAAKQTAIVKRGGTPGSASGGMGVTDDGSGDGTIFGLPPVLVAAGAAVIGYFGIRAVQSKTKRAS